MISIASLFTLYLVLCGLILSFSESSVGKEYARYVGDPSEEDPLEKG